ncbi:MAG: 3-deoxy-D-manno-octulosonic acid transferase [bacterium]|jgi:3-deoxy-D-manno-octulosonic-acid transferase
MIWLIYNLLFPVLFLAMLPYFLFRMCRRGGYAKGFMQRLGIYDVGLKARIRERPRVWVHAVSVGETYVALRFMEEWRQVQPDIAFVMTVNTSTAHTLASKALNKVDVLVYFPVDFHWVIRRVLCLLNPKMLVLTECEFWPNLIRMSKARGIPVLLINGRMSDRSFKGYHRLRWLFTPLLRMVDHLCVQGPQDRDRYLALGAAPEHVQETGSAKYDVALKEPGDLATASAILASGRMGPGDLILLGGSTWPGEEDVLLEYFVQAKSLHAGLKLVLVPRHAERREEVVAMIAQRGLKFVQRSKADAAIDGESPEVLLVDTTGELKHLYTAATVIFIGKSLTQHGGQNIIEPAVCGRPVVVGPNMENFADIVREFKAADALIQVGSEAELREILDQLLADETMRKTYGDRASAWVEQKRGSIKTTVARAQGLLLNTKKHG